MLPSSSLTPLGLALPSFDATGFSVTAFQVLVAATSFQSQISAATPYSKFSDGLGTSSKKTMLTGRQGMLLIYTPALVRSLVALPDALSAPEGSRELLVVGMLIFHFLKRCLEALFVHKYSGTVDAGTSGFIGVYYAIVASLVISFQSGVSNDLYSKSNSFFVIGIALFVIGQIGNLYHHCLLSSLRDEKKAPNAAGTNGNTARVYKIPSGGLFSLVATPHYLFEIIAWVGVGLVCQQLNCLLVAVGMASYLGGRAVTTNKWNRENIRGYPTDRKNIVPFLF